MDLEINYDHTHCHIAIKGEFTFQDNDMFRKMLNDIHAHSLTDIDVNLGNAHYIDSAALGMFLLLRDLVDEKNIRLSLLSPKGQVKKMFDLSQFDTVFTIKE